MARLDRTLERFIREAEGGGAFDPYTLAKALDDAVAAPPEAAGEAVAPLVRFVDWAVRSGHNEGIDPASRASAARLAEFDQAGANPRNLPAFLAGVLAAAALFQLAPRDESQEPPASRRRDAARALLAAAEAWSDEATLIFARMLWDLHRPGGEFFGGGKVRVGEEDTRRQVLASLHSRWPAGAVREILGRVLARALGVRVREDASASPRELPRGVAEAIGLWARLGGDRERLGLRRPATPRALAEVEAKLGPRVPDALVSFYAQSDGLGGREIAAARALVGLQRELAATLGQHAAEAEAEGALALARGEIDVRTMGPPSTLLAIGTDGAGDYFLMRVGDPRVYRFVHDELCSVRPVATTLGAFVAGQMMLAHDRWRSDDAGERLVAREAKAAEAAVAEARRAARRQVARRAEGEASEAKPRAGASATRAGATRAGATKAGVKKASAKEGPAKKGSAKKGSAKKGSAKKARTGSART